MPPFLPNSFALSRRLLRHGQSVDVPIRARFNFFTSTFNARYGNIRAFLGSRRVSEHQPTLFCLCDFIRVFQLKLVAHRLHFAACSTADNLASSKAASASSARVVCSRIERMKSARASSRSCARSLRSARSSSAARMACIFS